MHKPNPNDGKNGLTWVFEIYLWNPNIKKFKIFEAFCCGFGYYHIQNNDFDFKVLRFGRSVRQNPSLLGDYKGLDFQVYTLRTNS